MWDRRSMSRTVSSPEVSSRANTIRWSRPTRAERSPSRSPPRRLLSRYGLSARSVDSKANAASATARGRPSLSWALAVRV